MADTNINPSTINLRSKGLANSCGKLHKGCIKDATTKLSIGSIPSTYQSIIYKVDNKKAFGTSQKRFYDKKILDITQANSEDNTSSEELIQNITKVNHNKLGQNSFVSKQKREWIRCVRTPGPTHYYRDEEKQFETRPRKCFTRQSRKNQKREKNFEKQQIISPGPGQYIYDTQQCWSTSYKGWKSSFETKGTRNGYIPSTITPGPGCYNTDQLHFKKQKQTKKNSSPEKQNLDINPFLEKLTSNAKAEPGPGSYNHEVPNFKPLYQKIKMSANFMAPIVTSKKKNKDIPGPAAYPVKRIYEDLSPKLIYSTFFMSQTKRDVFAPKKLNDAIEINPQPIGHKNFHFNIKNQWIC